MHLLNIITIVYSGYYSYLNKFEEEEMRLERQLMGLVLLTSLVLIVVGCSNKNAPTASHSLQLNAPLVSLPNAIDNVKLIGDDESETVYEDAEDGSIHRWFIYNSQGSASLANEYDAVSDSRVITFYDAGDQVIYGLGNGLGETLWTSTWNNTTQFILQWSLRYDTDFQILVYLLTNAGRTILRYIPGDAAPTILNGIGVFSLGVDATDGQWHTYQRDLRVDLATLFSDRNLISVLLFKVKSNSDNIPPPEWDARTPGFWKNNIRKVMLEGKTNGVQLTAEELTQYLNTIDNFYLSPFHGITFEEAYEILSVTGPDPIDILKKHLLAAEFNYAAGAYIHNNMALMQDFLRLGEDMILEPGTKEEILLLKDHYDHFNNNDYVMWP